MNVRESTAHSTAGNAPQLARAAHPEKTHCPIGNSGPCGGRFAALSGRHASAPSSVGKLHRRLRPVDGHTQCKEVLERFQQDTSLHALPVIDLFGRPFALIERHAFIEYFSHRYSVDLHGRKPVNQVLHNLSAINCSPIVVDADTSVDEAAQRIIEGGVQHMLSGFIVSEDGCYLGVANGHDLLDDITRRKQAELYHLAHYDQLTGVANRMLITERLQAACHEAQLAGRMVGLMFIDLDRFKQINDTMGHRYGDLLLQSVARRLESCLRASDTVARLGGDEFALLLDHLPDTEHAEAAAQRVLSAFQQPFDILDRQLFVTVSVGIAIYPRDDANTLNLLAKADAAMYEAKKSGRNGYRKYVPGLSMHSLQHMTLEADLRQALERGEMELHYQPQISVQDGSVPGLEALVRWRHPQHGMLSPGTFIPIAEESGLIVDIGQWVLREACRQQKAWSSRQPLRMAINISAVQFRRGNFVELVRAVLEETGADPGMIELELTENIAMHHADDVHKTLCELKALGVLLAIDDFGTGFSSLSYLQRFPIDRLKIDQSFIRDIENRPANRSIVQAIVVLGKSLSLEVIAEGVESESELHAARESGCDEVQGYLYSPALSAEALWDWLDARDAAKITARLH